MIQPTDLQEEMGKCEYKHKHKHKPEVNCVVVVHPVEHDLRSPIPASCNIASHLVLRWPEHLFHLFRRNVEEDDDEEEEEKEGADGDRDELT